MRHFSCIFILSLCLASASCKIFDVITQTVTTGLAATGIISGDTKRAIDNVGAAAGKAMFESMTPENEYYIGRAVCASVLGQFPAIKNKKANTYLNQLGVTLAVYSDMPSTFKGYRLVILSTDDITAYAAPGGFIMVSKGLIACCKTEDELAAVIAHEIGHIELGHAMRAINASRWTKLGTVTVAEGLKTLGPDLLADAVNVLEGALDDIVQDLVNNGYSPDLELEADQAALRILKNAGYNPYALYSILDTIDKHTKPDDKGFAKTHPDPRTRMKVMTDQFGDSKQIEKQPDRQTRFSTALKSIIK